MSLLQRTSYSNYLDLQSIRVTGEHHTRVEPDRVALQCQVSRNSPGAEEAISRVEKCSADVQAYLKEANIENVAVSQMNLCTTFTNIPNTFDYQATIVFHVIVEDLNRSGEILSGMIAAGANTVLSTEFQSTQIEQIRAGGRTAAMQNAREKAAALCEGGQATLGRVLSIEDRSPTQQQQVQQFQGLNNFQNNRFGNQQAVQGVNMIGAAPGQAMNPASILVSTTVDVLFEIESLENEPGA